MKDFKVKNCGCNQDPCKTYGSEEEQKAEYEELKEMKMRKPSMQSLLKDWRKLINEHVTDEEHEHPHGDEYNEVEEGSTSSETSSTRTLEETDENDEGSSCSDSSSSRVGDESDEDHCDETIEERWSRLAFGKGNQALHESDEVMKDGIPHGLWVISDYEDAMDMHRGDYDTLVAKMKWYNRDPDLGYLERKVELLRADIEEEMAYLDDLQNQYDSAIYPKEQLIGFLEDIIQGRI